jgi:hypothetical protein
MSSEGSPRTELQRSIKLREQAGQPADPTDSAFLALVEARRGDLAAGRAHLVQLLAALHSPRYADSLELARLRVEVEGIYARLDE